MIEMSTLDTPRRPRGALRPGSVLAAWVLTIGIDLFFNAGIFSPLFDQAREPNLLADESLFRRIPVAYAGLLVAVVAVAWLIDRMGVQVGKIGAAIGAGVGVVLASMGVVSLWTAIDMTLGFVVAAAVVQITEMAGAGATLAALSGASRPRRAIVSTLALALAAALLGVIVQNLI